MFVQSQKEAPSRVQGVAFLKLAISRRRFKFGCVVVLVHEFMFESAFACACACARVGLPARLSLRDVHARELACF